MSKEKKPENPYAFPVIGEGVYNKGMSLRDYFAAKAMQGTLSNEDRITQVIIHKKDGSIEDYIAEACYKMADAMLKARQ